MAQKIGMGEKLVLAFWIIVVVCGIIGSFCP